MAQVGKLEVALRVRRKWWFHLAIWPVKLLIRLGAIRDVDRVARWFGKHAIVVSID